MRPQVEKLRKVLKEKNIKVISCMGMGNKLDPSKIEITDIRKISAITISNMNNYY